MANMSVKQPDIESNDFASERALATRPIDLTHLARQALGDHALELEILRMYDVMISERFEQLNSEGSTDIALHLHAIKGASAGVGASNVAQHAKLLEQHFEAHGTLDAELLADLQFVVSEVRDFIATLVD